MTSADPALTLKQIPRTPEGPLPFVRYVLRHCPPLVRQQAGVTMLFSITAHTLDTLLAWALGRLVGAATSAAPQEVWAAVIPEIVLLGALWMARSLGLRGFEFLERRYVPVLVNTTRELLFHRLIEHSQSFLHSNFAGVLANHVRSAGDTLHRLQDKLMHNILPLFVRFTVAGLLLWPITPALTLFVGAFALLALLAGIRTAPRRSELSRQHAETSSRLTGYIVDSVTNLIAVHHNAGWREERKRHALAQQEIAGAFRRRQIFYSWFWGIFDTVMMLFSCGFMALVVVGWQMGGVSTAQLAMTVGLVMNLFGAVAGTLSIMGGLSDDIGVFKDALERIATPIEVLDVPGAPALRIKAGEIEFRNVRFGYHKDRPVFDGLSLTIAPGEKVGILGPSGAGKTTLCQLLLRSYDVQDGSICIDGQNIAGVSRDSLHQAVAVIPQEPGLFHRTLAENIRYGRPEATPEEVRAAARAAQADGFISQLASGYDTLVGERGIKLSGGQRQRVAIARAILRAAPILLLDEATSALDSETEQAIQSAMANAMAGRTVLVIAHRLSTLRQMDRLIVMDAGRIVEDGRFEDLLARQGLFARLWSLQAGGFLPPTLPPEDTPL